MFQHIAEVAGLVTAGTFLAGGMAVVVDAPAGLVGAVIGFGAVAAVVAVAATLLDLWKADAR
ncbi:hypothetical protein [Solwaraspora sp. WMMD792]|uniref:hypothetical protein n=1 Tax=Solwaraspora sp. WMMD792 TaxID=3016099 RepID=UPI0024178FC9|nr:hypothetical protein [Solwaraspora sp. WMMD792]MDG4770693.1 hypothetical protein [Solwaraspora sp. WMMD792]